MGNHLNHDLGFDEVRWATMRKTSYDSRQSFRGTPEKKLLPAGTHLYRLVRLTTGVYFEAVWWMPERIFNELHDDANRSTHGGGRLFRNYVAQFMALPFGQGGFQSRCRLIVPNPGQTSSNPFYGQCTSGRRYARADC